MSIVVDSVMEDASAAATTTESATEKTVSGRTKRASSSSSSSSSSRKKREPKKVKPSSSSEIDEPSETTNKKKDTVSVSVSTDVAIPTSANVPTSLPIESVKVTVENANHRDSSTDSKVDHPTPHHSPVTNGNGNGTRNEQSHMLSLMSEVHGYLVEESKCLNDEVMDFVIKSILDIHKKTEEVTYINSLSLSNAIRKDIDGRYGNHNLEESIKAFSRDLGINNDRGGGKAELVLVVLHGPCTEMQKAEQNRRRFYTNMWEGDEDHLPAHRITEDPNNHWSLLCSFRHPTKTTTTNPARKGDTALVHYDSLAGYNRPKCDEALRILQKYGILPKTDTYYVPDFMPIQSDVWECGYYPLLFTAILLNDNDNDDDDDDGRRGMRPIEKTTLEKYENFIKTLTDPNGEFRNYLRHSVLRTRMNRFLVED